MPVPLSKQESCEEGPNTVCDTVSKHRPRVWGRDGASTRERVQCSAEKRCARMPTLPQPCAASPTPPFSSANTRTQPSAHVCSPNSRMASQGQQGRRCAGAAASIQATPPLNLPPQATADDAGQSKRSAVSLGYYTDECASSSASLTLLTAPSPPPPVSSPTSTPSTRAAPPS